MANQTVTVTFNGNGEPLGINPLQVNLGAGDSVTWNFQNIPLESLVYIYFNDPPGQPFGPFVALKPVNNTVTGIGNSGQTGSYSYTAMVLNQNGPLAISERVNASVENTSDATDTVFEAIGLITYNPEDSPPLQVSPSPLNLGSLQRATWLIEGLPEEAFITFHFDGFPDPLTGPFTTFLLSQAFGTTRLAVGTGLDIPPETQGNPVPYFVEVRDPLGAVIASDDPVIEPLGTPPNP